MKQTHTDLNVPRWDLTTIYTDLSSPSYKNAVAEYKKGMDQLDTLLASAACPPELTDSHFDFPLWLSTYYEAANRTGALEESLAAYAYIIYSTDTTNKTYLDNLSDIEKMGLRSQDQALRFSSILKAHSFQLEDFYKRFRNYTSYRYIIQETLDETEHQMSGAEENLASDLQRTGGDAWEKLHEQIISNLKDQDTGKTFNELRNDACSDDPALRKASWEKEINLLKQNRIPIAAALNNIKGETVTLNGRRSWKQAIDRSLAASRMTKETLDSLIGAIEDSLPMWRDYMHFKAQLLRKAGATADSGKKDEAGLSFYDLFAPLPDPGIRNNDSPSRISRTWTFEEARNYIIKEYASFSTEMGNFAEYAFSHNWIDAEIRPGKVGGAYCQDFPVQGESRILSNFTGSFSDIITLAHELGHAYHHACIADRDYELTSYPMTLAETASTFAETLVKQDAISHSQGFDKMRLIELDLQDVCQVLVDILCRYYFEKNVFEARSKEELTADNFCTLMQKAQNDSYGDGLNGNRHEYMWAVKSHYYSTSLDFYNFPYAFGQLFAAGLYSRYRKEGPAFAAVYKTLLSRTGMMSCEDLCREAGFDITSKEFWKTGIDIYAGELQEMKSAAGLGYKQT